MTEEEKVDFFHLYFHIYKVKQVARNALQQYFHSGIKTETFFSELTKYQTS